MTEAVSDLLRRLADWTSPEGIGVLSVYLDVRPQASGERPGQRKDEIVLKDRLNAIEQSLEPRGPALDSFRADRARVEEALEQEVRGAAGLAIFACSAGGLFEVVQSGVPFEVRVTYGTKPALYQLARSADDFETSVVAVADTNTLRLFTMRLGRLSEAGVADEDSVSFQKRSTGGYSEARYQRHIDKHRREFAEEAAGAIADLVEKEGATRLVLAGDEVAIPLLRDALPRQVADRLAGDAVRVHIRANRDEIADEVDTVLAEAEAQSGLAIADQLVGEVLERDMGVSGRDTSQAALEAGQGDVLVFSSSFGPSDAREELTRLALQTAARVEVVEGHERLEAMGGVGVILRYRV